MARIGPRRAGRTLALTFAAALATTVPAQAGAAPVTRGAMAEAVTSALGLSPADQGPAYRDVQAGAAYAPSVEAGANAGLWPQWQPGAAFRPGAAATFGQALGALVAGLGGARIAADLPEGLRRAATALGLWPASAPPLSAPLTPDLLAWLAGRARVAPRDALIPLDALCVRRITWLWGGGPVGVGEAAWLGAVAVDRRGYALPVAVDVTASAGTEDNAVQTFYAPAAAGRVTLTARAPNGVSSDLGVTVDGPLRLGLLGGPSPALSAGRPIVLEVAVRAGAAAPFAGDNGRTIALTVRQGGRRTERTASDDLGVAAFRIGPLRAGPAELSLRAAGLATRTYDVRVRPARAPGHATASLGGDLSLSAPVPTPAGPAGRPFAAKGLWLPYWIWKATPANRLVAQARRSGVATIYLEVATSANGFYGRAGLRTLLPLAHRHGLRVVAWVYADLSRPALDFANVRSVLAFTAPGGLKVAGLALDLEGAGGPPAWALEAELALARRRLGPAGALLAVTEPDAALPYRAIARYANAIAPMDYWHGRMQGMGYPIAYRAVAASIRTIRAAAPGASISVILQAFDMFTPSGRGVYAPTAAELSGAVAAARAGGAQGVSYYQWGTVSAAEWRVVELPWGAPGRRP